MIESRIEGQGQSVDFPVFRSEASYGTWILETHRFFLGMVVWKSKPVLEAAKVRKRLDGAGPQKDI
jgi:hypothetical protein